MNRKPRLFSFWLSILLTALLLPGAMAGCRCGTDEPPPPEEGEWPGANIDGFVFGVDLGNLDADWQRALLTVLKQDIRHGLPERRADLSGMIRIPAGEAGFGCDVPPGPGHECLARQRQMVAAFYIDRLEVSNRQYERCVAERQCLPVGRYVNIENAHDPDRPALLSFKQAERYCAWAGKRLPTEYEWEKAARGRLGQRYPWGDESPTPDRGNLCGSICTMAWARADWNDGYAVTAPVEAFPAGDSPYGVRQMGGNVKEWVISAERLPAWHFIARGASWYSDFPEIETSYRQMWRPGVRIDDKGVRCAVDESMLRQ